MLILIEAQEIVNILHSFGIFKILANGLLVYSTDIFHDALLFSNMQQLIRVANEVTNDDFEVILDGA